MIAIGISMPTAAPNMGACVPSNYEMTVTPILVTSVFIQDSATAFVIVATAETKIAHLVDGDN